MKRKKGKPRKRTSKDVPAKGRLRDIADRLWSFAVRSDWNWKCAVCGHGKVEAHHVICRQHARTRYMLRNGLSLCSTHHQFDADVSPHQNAAGFLLWLSDTYPELHQWYTETVERNQHKVFMVTTNATYYCDVIRNLKQYVSDEDYERIVGIKFSRWLEEGKL